ncbi:MAG: purine permease [Alkalinema sp. RU_4_3]|nr:purine permease [Alkalinema sp. RU_4_3]
MKANFPQRSELNPPNNITPSVATTLTGLLVLLPLGVFLIGMYSGAFSP